MGLTETYGTGEWVVATQGVQADNVESLTLMLCPFLADKMIRQIGSEVGDSCHIINFIQEITQISSSINQCQFAKRARN